jgi:hypothetical protein
MMSHVRTLPPKRKAPARATGFPAVNVADLEAPLRTFLRDGLRAE